MLTGEVHVLACMADDYPSILNGNRAIARGAHILEVAKTHIFLIDHSWD